MSLRRVARMLVLTDSTGRGKKHGCIDFCMVHRNDFGGHGGAQPMLQETKWCASAPTTGVAVAALSCNLDL